MRRFYSLRSSVTRREQQQLISSLSAIAMQKFALERGTASTQTLLSKGDSNAIAFLSLSAFSL